MDWTTPQKDAINYKDDKSAIVTANAGSGKTAVLVERIATLITDEKTPVDPSSLVVVTFTEKAAQELKTRLDSKLKELIDASEGKSRDFYISQQIKLNSAKISTISSFCFELIRENISYTHLAPGFGIMDEKKTALIKNSICESMLNEFLKNESTPEEKALIRQRLGKSFGELVGDIIRIDDFCRALTDRTKWEEDNLNDVFDSRIKSAYIEFINTNCDMAEKYLSSLKAVGEKIPPKDKKGGKYAAAEYCEELYDKEHGLYDKVKKANYLLTPELKDAFNDKLRKQAAPKKAEQDIQNEYLSARDGYIESRDRVYSYCDKMVIFEAGLKASKPLKELYIKLARKFNKEYTAYKTAKNLADFTDAEELTYRIIKENPDIAQQLDYSYITVDEFQDSNRLQYEIFKGLSKNGKNLYFVGDLKQSIYRFRGAQPEVFDQVCRDTGNYKELPLNENFRSCENVIKGINQIFCAVMTEEKGGVDYKNKAQLVYGGNNPFKGHPVEVHIENSKSIRDDALYVAKQIKELLNSNANEIAYDISKTTEGNDNREEASREAENLPERHYKPEDIYILLRSANNKADIYIDALKKEGISATFKGGDFLGQPEIATMMDLLSVIDNPYNDEAFVRLLLSPAFALSAKQVTAIKNGTVILDIDKAIEKEEKALKEYSRKNLKRRLYSMLRYLSSDKKDDVTFTSREDLFKDCPELKEYIIPDVDNSYEILLIRALYSCINELMAKKSSLTPGELISAIYRTNSIRELLLISAESDRAEGNLDLLLQYAEAYSDSEGGIEDFIRYLDDLVQRGKNLDIAETTDKNCVTVMSIHGSKGLQFPVVFVANCDCKFNQEDTKKPVFLSEKYGLAFRIEEKALMRKIPSPSYTLAPDEEKSKLYSEEMRLLYVAATRAKEKLVFTGGGTKTALIPDSENYISWICRSISAKELSDVPMLIKDSILFVNNYYEPPESDEDTVQPPDSDIISSDTKEESPFVSEKATEDIVSNIQKRYAFFGDTKIHSKYSATELTRNERMYTGSDKFGIYISRPTFTQSKEKGKLSGKKRGDAYHKCMENLPFSLSLTVEEISRFIADESRSHLNEAERNTVEAEVVYKFFQTPQAEEMLKDPDNRIYKEYKIFHKINNFTLSAEKLGIDKDIDFSSSEIYVQGIVDLFYIDKEGIILIDYKSDSNTSENKLKKEYAYQLQLYAEALTQEFSLPVKNIYIYSFEKGMMIPLNKAEKEEE